jgi:hypothetical protein
VELVSVAVAVLALLPVQIAPLVVDAAAVRHGHDRWWAWRCM